MFVVWLLAFAVLTVLWLTMYLTDAYVGPTPQTGSLRESVFGILHPTKHVCMSEVIGVLKDIVRVMAIFIGGLVGLLVVVVVYLDLTRIPDPDIQLGRVDRDTTFYIGKSESDPGGGVTISLLATGLLDKSDASVLIEYTRPPATATACKLPAGLVDQIYGSDFYDNRAKVTYRHGAVQHGHLRLRFVFAYPPKEWGKHPTKY